MPQLKCEPPSNLCGSRNTPRLHSDGVRGGHGMQPTRTSDEGRHKDAAHATGGHPASSAAERGVQRFVQRPLRAGGFLGPRAAAQRERGRATG
jgi:hypothetical protein